MERGQHRYNHENESVSADNPNPSLSDVPVHQVQKRISRQDETIFVAPSNIQHRRPSHKSHQQRRSSRKSEVLIRKKHLNLSTKTSLDIQKSHVSVNIHMDLFGFLEETVD